MHLIFLGTGAGCGVPSFFCDCIACQESRANPYFARTRCSLMIQGDVNTLIDAPPELRDQLIRERIDRIDNFFLTHWHYDHTGGLGELEFYVRLKRQKVISAYMTKDTSEWLESTFWFMIDCLSIQTLAYGDQVEVDGLVYSILEVQHAPGTVGLLLETKASRPVAYLPDTGPLPEKTAERIRNIDVLILDGTFWGENWMPNDHQSVESAVKLALELEAKEIYLTHLSMHHDKPVTNQELEDFLRSFGNHIHLAYDGLRIPLSEKEVLP